MDRSKALAALSALAHETRLDLIRLLTPRGAAGMAAGQIAEALGMPAPRLSFHLSALEQAGLLKSRKVARNVFYSVDPRGIGQTISYVLNDCCSDHPEVLAACVHRRQGADAVSGTANT
ncbi:ArsR/SmtB family transcription factor [Tabrizicola flagellatus]|uniref:ArsR/SmtB family transcription factor n=1 Tax=Tabrizicola flagellatus TaxID=2593021 RepID=UPI0011F11A55|nr:metalloregulator ArsR/SmtB family transcription factor [Tabrizicola flagellatus]